MIVPTSPTSVQHSWCSNRMGAINSRPNWKLWAFHNALKCCYCCCWLCEEHEDLLIRIFVLNYNRIDNDYSLLHHARPWRPTTGIILIPKSTEMKLNHQNWPSIGNMNWISFGFLPFAYTAHTMLQNIKSRSKFQCRTTNFSLPLPLSFLFLVPLTKYLLQPIFFPTFRSLLWDEYQSSISQWLELIHGHRKFPIKQGSENH